jgi:hypothetical protein
MVLEVEEGGKRRIEGCQDREGGREGGREGRRAGGRAKERKGQERGRVTGGGGRSSNVMKN